MQKIAIVQASEGGGHVASVLRIEFDATYVDRQEVGRQWKDFDAFVFVGAMGICVRTIAPHVHDKHTDPAVVCVDSTGQNAVAVLSGHVGGANDLTQTIAGLLGAVPVITTQSDNAGLWALDTLCKRFGWADISDDDMDECIFAFVNRKPTALLLECRDAGTDYLERTLPEHVTIINDISEAVPEKFKLLIIVSPYFRDVPDDMLGLIFVPIIASIGFGFAHNPDNHKRIFEEMSSAITDHGMYPCASRYYTIDVKKDEEFCKTLEKSYGVELCFFTAEELAAVDVPNPSETVEKHVGTPSVCEAAAILGSNHGELVIPKVKGKDWTVAMAIASEHLRRRQGYVEIVGAGPGAPDLVSVRGRRLLERADLILYAGSLVPRELTTCHKPGAVVRSSAGMDLEEQCQLMKKFYDEGKYVVRLHTGDPCIFGAIQEQMAFFDQQGMEYHITPGISSFLAAAAELRSQFTIPERTQTIILTRGEGRTAMPEREKLHLLARSQSTMCIFLSAAIVDDVQAELLQEYPEDTPVAACYHLTWPDQRICRGVLKDLARIVHDNHFTLTTMIVVGEAIGNRKGLSELYNKHFTHLFRKAGD